MSADKMLRLNSSEADDNDFTMLPTNNPGVQLEDLFKDDDDASSSTTKSSLFYKPRAQRSQSGSDNSLNTTTSNKMSMNVKFASAVEVYRFDNTKYNHLGKFGMALLGNDDICAYQLIIYTGTQVPICVVKIVEEFNFVCQANNYANFYDEKRCNWSVMFASDVDRASFARQIAWALFNIRCDKKKNPFLLKNFEPSAEMKKADLLNKTIQFRYTITGVQENRSKAIVENATRNFTFDDSQSSSSLFDILPTPATSKQKYLILSLDKCEESSIIGSVLPISSAADKISIELWFEQFVEQVAPKKEIDTIPPAQQDPLPAKLDLATKMAKIGGLRLLPEVIDGKHQTPEPKQVAEEQSKPKQIEEELKPKEDHARLELLVEKITKDLEEIKQSLSFGVVSKSSNVLSSSPGQSIDLVINTLQKLFEDNRQSQEEPKTVESNNCDQVNLREDICELKDKINLLKEENYKMAMLNLKFEKLSLDMSKKVESLNNSMLTTTTNDNSKHVLKSCLNYVYTKFNESLQESAVIEDEELMDKVADILAAVMVDAKQQFQHSKHKPEMEGKNLSCD